MNRSNNFISTYILHGLFAYFVYIFFKNNTKQNSTFSTEYQNPSKTNPIKKKVNSLRNMPHKNVPLKKTTSPPLFQPFEINALYASKNKKLSPLPNIIPNNLQLPHQMFPVLLFPNTNSAFQYFPVSKVAFQNDMNEGFARRDPIPNTKTKWIENINRPNYISSVYQSKTDGSKPIWEDYVFSNKENNYDNVCNEEPIDIISKENSSTPKKNQSLVNDIINNDQLSSTKKYNIDASEIKIDTANVLGDLEYLKLDISEPTIIANVKTVSNSEMAQNRNKFDNNKFDNSTKPNGLGMDFLENTNQKEIFDYDNYIAKNVAMNVIGNDLDPIINDQKINSNFDESRMSYPASWVPGYYHDAYNNFHDPHIQSKIPSDDMYDSVHGKSIWNNISKGAENQMHCFQ